MKKLLLLTMLLFTTTFLLAQDTIYLRNRQLIHGTIKRRNRSFIYYQRQGKIRNAPLLACALIDSIKYSNGLTWRLLDYTTARHEKKQLAVKQKKQRSRFDEPYVNRIAIGATNMDPVFILERLLGSGRGITPVIAAGITYERRIVKNNGSVFAISSFGLNRDFTGIGAGGRYFFFKRPSATIGAGPYIGFANQIVEEQDETVDTYHGYPIVIKRYPSNSLTYAVNFNVQLNNRKHLFLSHDFFPGGSHYLRSDSWSGHFAYRLSVGLRF